MRSCRLFWLAFALAATLICPAVHGQRQELKTSEFTLRMPLAKPAAPETYLCTPMKLDRSQTHYIVGFKPLAEKKTAHHMLLYGCKKPASTDAIFNCGSMTTRQPGLATTSQPCGSGSTVVYAWALNAPELALPEGVGFEVGGEHSDIDWLVLQVHYADVSGIPEEGDKSGVVLKYTNIPQPRSAGVYYTSSNGRMPAQTVTHVEAACTIYTTTDLHPFAFRTHTHSLGTAVSGWKVTNNREWTLLGKKDPQLPQMFYPTNDNTTVLRNGDKLATRCTMDNFKNHAVYMGSTREDEMCNFYLMYWVEGRNVNRQGPCNSLGPPLYSWGGWFIGGGLSNIPEKEASEI